MSIKFQVKIGNMSPSSELLPNKLKWLTISAFAGLFIVMVISYIFSPKIQLDSYNQDYSQESTPLLGAQATDSASIAIPNSSQSASESAQLDDNQPPSVQSVQDAEQPLSGGSASAILNTNPKDVNQPPAVSPQAPSQPAVKCQFSGSQIKKIFGISLSSAKVYFTPLHKDLYQSYLEKFKNNTKLISWYCTESEARQAGFTNSMQIQQLLKNLIKR